MRICRVYSAALVLATALAAALLAAPAPARAADAAAGTASLERSVKAAFLFKFLSYAEFPPTAFADPAAPFTIGVLGADELAGELARLVAGRSVASRPVAVRALRENDTGAPVHLMFIGGADSGRVGRVLRTVPPGPVLTVTEAEQGLHQGSIINFKIVDERVRFDVSLEAAERNNVRLSSRLLSVASAVHKEAP
jgi:hypothetical protein